MLNKGKQKILTVIIPTYNVEKYLARTLDTLLLEDSLHEKLELLVVNDGSKDSSLAIAKEYEEKYPTCVIVIDKENGGHGSTINAGLRVATGKYLRVIDSDDWVNVDDFPKYVNDLESLDVDVVLTNYSREEIYRSESVLFKYNKKIPYNKVIDMDTYDFRTFKSDYFFMATSTFKTEKLREAKLQLSEKAFYVDMEFILLPFASFNTFIYLDYDIYRYFIGRPDQSTSIQSFVRNRAHHEKVLRRLLSYYEDLDTTDNRKAYISQVILLMCNTHYTIYCAYKLPNRAAVKEVRIFDKFFKETAPDIYEEAGLKYPYIAMNRKTNFIFAQFLFSFISRYMIRKAYEKMEDEVSE